MTRYSELYERESLALRETKRELALANEFVTCFREFVRARDLHHDFLEFLLVRHLGETEAVKFLADSPADAKIASNAT
jgi:hypothetical protein